MLWPVYILQKHIICYFRFYRDQRSWRNARDWGRWDVTRSRKLCRGSAAAGQRPGSSLWSRSAWTAEGRNPLCGPPSGSKEWTVLLSSQRPSGGRKMCGGTLWRPAPPVSKRGRFPSRWPSGLRLQTGKRPPQRCTPGPPATPTLKSWGTFPFQYALKQKRNPVTLLKNTIIAW